MRKSRNPVRSNIEGREVWLFADGKTLPVVAGGDETATTPVSFRSQLVDKLNERIAARQAAHAELTALLEAPTAEARDLNATETTQFAELRASIAAFDITDATDAGFADSIASMRARVAEMDALEVRHEAVRQTEARIQVKSDEHTYRKGGEHSFFADLFAQHHRTGGYDVAERLQRNTDEWAVDKRDIGIAAMAGAIPPVYLLDEWAPLARAGSPFLNSLTAMDLPDDGVSFIIPRGTTGTTAAMTSEGAGFNEIDLAVTDLTSTVNLVTAQQDISRTVFMRGGSVVDSIIFPDLMEALALAGNVSAINGNGTPPQHRGILQVTGIAAVTYTDGSPTVPELWPKISDAIQQVNSLRFMPVTAIYMHPRRWGFITSATDTTGRPLFDFSKTVPNTVFGLGDAAAYGQIVGTLQSIPVITDASIPTNLGAGTNEDIIFMARMNDIKYWRAPVMSFTFEQTTATAPGQVRLAVGQFQLFVPGRYPTSIATIGGTGCTPPSF